ARRAAAGSIPIVPAPIAIGAVEVEHHVINEIGNIEILADVGVGEVVSNAGVGNGEKRVPGSGIAIDQLVGVEGIVFRRIAAKIMGRIRGVALLTNIVKTPIKAVEVKMDVGAVRAVAPHGILG